MRTMKTAPLCVLLLCLFNICGHADVWGHVWVDYDPGANQVIATCETDIDLNSLQYYSPIVDCFILDGNGYGVANGHYQDMFNTGGASVTIEATAQADETYTAEAENSVEMIYYRPDYSGYYDANDYYYWTFAGVYAPCCFDYYAGPNGPQYGPNTQYDMGTVYASVSTPAPHHLKVLSDTISSLCTSPTVLRRIIMYQEVSVDNKPVGTMQSKESFGTKSTNTCGNGDPRTSETCSTDSNGIFGDDLKIASGCITAQGSCGVTYTHQQWRWCKRDGTSVVIATPGDVIVHNDYISVGGNTTGFSAGTYIYP